MAYDGSNDDVMCEDSFLDWPLIEKRGELLAVSFVLCV